MVAQLIARYGRIDESVLCQIVVDLFLAPLSVLAKLLPCLPFHVGKALQANLRVPILFTAADDVL